MLRSLSTGNDSEQFCAVQTWRRQWTLPRHILLLDSDNELPIDLDNALSVETFLHLVKRREVATVVEMLP
jgi:hypothetical protein